MAGILHFRDLERPESKSFINHLAPNHNFKKIILLSGDRASEVNYLAKKIGINNFYSSQSPEQKLEIVKKETQNAPTLFMGDGINDAPALMLASVGIAFGQGNNITSESSGAVILESNLLKEGELKRLFWEGIRRGLLGEVFWQIVRFGGIGVLLGWILRSCSG